MHRPKPIPGLEFCGEWKSTKKLRRLPRHRNEGLEIVLITKGAVRWVIEDREFSLKANTFFYTLPWQDHGGRDEIQPSCEILYLCVALRGKERRPKRRFRFHPALGFTGAEEAMISRAFTRHPEQMVTANEPGAWLMRHFFEVVADRSRWGRSGARDTLRLLLLTVARLAATKRSADSFLPETERRVENFAAMLPARHAEPWTLDAMSEFCRLGRTQFAQLLKQRTGDTPLTYLNRLRVRAAQKLLAGRDLSITEIAHGVGFNSSQYFATVFKEFTDMDARSYRASLRSREKGAPGGIVSGEIRAILER